MFQTERLVIEPVEARHVDGIVAAIRASLDELRPWMTWTIDWDPEESERYLLDREEHETVWAVMLDGEPVGVIGVMALKPIHSWGEIGYWLRSDLHGRGLMSEALAPVVNWAFDGLGLHRLELRAGVDNGPSNRLAEKLGFSNRGVIRESARGSGGWYDCNLWELLEPTPAPGSGPRSRRSRSRRPWLRRSVRAGCRPGPCGERSPRSGGRRSSAGCSRTCEPPPWRSCPARSPR